VDGRCVDGECRSVLSPLRTDDVVLVPQRSSLDWRGVVGGAGKVLIAVGVLMFGFVAYQLWGTGIENELAQQRLEDDFDQMLAGVDKASPTDLAEADGGETDVRTAPPAPTTTSSILISDAIEAGDASPVPAAAPSAPAVPVAEQRIPELDNGAALARLEIPAIDVDDIVVAGIGVSDLKKGPGHFPDTPLPGQLGNSAIAGHRTTYGAPFFDVDQLEVGDEMIVTTLTGRYVYEIEAQQVVEPSAYEVVATSDPSRATLTLVSCEPKWTAQNRIVITGALDVERSGPIGEPLLDYGRSLDATVAKTPRTSADDAAPLGTGVVGELAVPDNPRPVVSSNGAVTGSMIEADGSITASTSFGVEPTSSALADAFDQGWFSDPAANVHVGLWGAALALIAAGSWWLSRRSGRNLVGAAAGVAPFVLALFFFYQNVNRLLPPGL
jgi:sortase A